ncbi:MAG: pantoate--beta-alanine ligase [Desulfarculus sp.]|nr:MAG: pantoate--beta-alanine ligase [Desulfarculus sp.]
MPEPRVIRTPQEMAAASQAARAKGQRVGLVPTMGALHAGHLSLVDFARPLCGLLVVSIFVNPLQFDRAEDLEHYPVTWEADHALCAAHGVDAIYAPTAAAMYPQGFQSKVRVEGLTQELEGAFRPGHFDGVTTVVLKLFNAVGPHLAVFGEKDYQQLRVIQRMAQDLDLGVEVIGRPTVREPDGLALSSRNVHLSPEERKHALCLRRALDRAQERVRAGERGAAALRAAALAVIEATPGARLDYLEVVDAQELTRLTRLDRPARMVMAVWMGKTRLIDNDALN